MDQISTASVITIVISVWLWLKQASAYFVTVVMPKLDLLLKWVLTTSVHINFNVDISFGKPTVSVKNSLRRSSLGR